MCGFLAVFSSPLINDAAQFTALTTFRVSIARWLAKAGIGRDSGSRGWAMEVARRQGWMHA